MHNQKQKNRFYAYQIGRILAQKSSVPHLQKQRWDKPFLGSYKSTKVFVCLLLLTGTISSAAINKSTLFAAGTDQFEQTIPATSTALPEEEAAPTSTAVTSRRTATRTPRSTARSTPRSSNSTPTYTPLPAATATNTPPPTISSPIIEPTATRRQSAGASASIYIDSLRLRSAPNESSSIVGGVVKGQSYRVLNISEDGIWIRLAVDNLPGGWGWVPARYTSVKGDITGIAISNDSTSELETESAVSDRSTALPGDAIVDTSGSRLRVRSAPSGDSDIVSHVYDGDAHRVLERSANGRWARLELDDQAEGGWVSVSYLKLGRDVPAPGQVAQALAAPTATWTPRPLNTASAIAASPITTSTPSSQATQTAVAPTATWTAIPINSSAGSAIGVAVVRTTGGSRLRVREEPNTSALILGYAYSERSYTVLDKNRDGSWVQISVPDLTEPGWVSVNFLDITFR